MEHLVNVACVSVPIVNDNPLNDLGYTHAPQTFYVSTKGYGILVNTARYTTFLCGSNQKIRQNARSTEGNKNKIALKTEELYENRSSGNKVFIDIPGAKGIEVFVITGPTLKDVVKRYNLLSGGGCLPPMWGLGFKYRVKGDAVRDSVMRFARYFREERFLATFWGWNQDGKLQRILVLTYGMKNVFPNIK